MVRFLVGTDDIETSASLGTYLEGRVDNDDVVFAINSLRGGGRTSSAAVLAGEEALDAIAERLEPSTTVETRQLVQGHDPVDDIVSFAEEHDIDEIVIGIRKRSPAGKIAFGSTAQAVLLNARRPVVSVPLEV